MKNKFKIILISAIMTFVFVVTAACSGDRRSSIGGGEGKHTNVEVDKTMSQLYVSNFDGGFGGEWLDLAIDRFEEENKDVSFESGKVGVQIIVDPNKDQGHNLVDNLGDNENQIFFTQGVNYYDFVNRNLFLDITDIMTEKLTAYGESRSIEDKLNEQQKQYLKTDDGKYYGVPHYTGLNAGIMYDVDLFEQKRFYFAADTTIDANTNKYNTDLNNGNKGFIIDKTDTRSNGPDGLPGTSDDGLPATYDEFFLLCDKIKVQGCTPIIWTGMYRRDYMKDFIRSLMIDYEGVEQAAIYYSYEGVAKNLVKSINNDGSVTLESATTLNNSNAYKIMGSAGRYYALKFYQTITSNTDYFDSKCFNDTVSHTDAQDEFLFSRAEGVSPIAMLIEGPHWVNEAKATFVKVAGDYGDEYSQNNRKLGIMPLPKATREKIGEQYTVLEPGGTFGFINANCDPAKIALAKKFLQYVNTDFSLREFTMTTNTTRSLDYDISSEDVEKLSYFGKQLWNIKKTYTPAYGYSSSEIWIKHQQTLAYEGFVATIGTTKYNDPVTALRVVDEGYIKAKDYFNGVVRTYDATWWNNLLN